MNWKIAINKIFTLILLYLRGVTVTTPSLFAFACSFDSSQNALHDSWPRTSVEGAASISKNSMVFQDNRCICYYYPDTQLVSQYETTWAIVGDDKLLISSPWLIKKNYVQCILCRWNVNFEQILQVLSLTYDIDILHK